MLRQYGSVVLKLVALVSVWLPTHYKPSFKYFVVFGDSYTDDGFGNWFRTHDNKAPPPGLLPPQTNMNSGGGLTWPQFVGNYTGASIYDYASSGATCSNNIVMRINPGVVLNVPSVVDDQLPKYEADTKTSLYWHVNAENTVYGLWIGANDLGVSAFLTDSQVPGTNLTSYVGCIWSVFDHIYRAGGRRFVLLNNNALQMTPLYQIPSKGGVGNSSYWPNKGNQNVTQYNQKMLEYVAMTNRMMDYGAPFNHIIKRRWPGASFALYNVHDLIVDIYHNPKEYLEAPYNVSGYFNDCPATGCSSGRQLNGYLWFDALHPSNKTSKLSRNFVSFSGP